jgi:hypothetical protein
MLVYVNVLNYVNLYDYLYANVYWPIVQGMLKEGKSSNYECQGLITKTRGSITLPQPILILCDKCYWCATLIILPPLPRITGG